MEPLHRRRSPARVPSPSSKITTIVDRSSPGEKLKSRHVAPKGNQQTTKQRISKPEEAYSNSNGNEAGQPLTERERSNSKLPSVTLMKSLLADEMSKGTEPPRKRTPSIIAKLMGLDGLPSPRSASKQSGRLSLPGGGIPEKVVPSGTGSRRTTSRPLNNQSSCNSGGKNQQLFKDVYEVRDSLMKGRSDSYTAAAHTPQPNRRRHAEDEEAFVRQKFMDAKRLSTDQGLQSSKEFDEALEVLNSNNHLFLKFLQEPDSLFAKHLRDLHDSRQSASLCTHIRSSSVLDYNINAIGSHQVGRESSRKIDISPSRGHMYSRRDVQHSDRSLNSRVEFKEEENAVPTQIVVLKPNLARMQKPAAKSSSPVSSSYVHQLFSDVKVRRNIHGDGGGGGPSEDGLRGKKNLPGDLELSAHKSRESRELAKEITQKMRQTLGEGPLHLSWSGGGHRGYSADESSHDMSENDSSYDSDVSVTIPTPETPRRRSILQQGKPLPSRYAESSLNREAKKRLSERWKMTQRREGKKVATNYGSTLGEMLAIQDIDVTPTNGDVSMGWDRFSSRFASSDCLEGWVDEPLGISSKDGCKEGYIVTLPRSRSLPPTPPHERSGRREFRNTQPSNKEGSSSERGRRRIIRKDLTSGKDGSYSGRLMRSGGQKSQSSIRINQPTMDGMEECHTDDMHRKSVCSAEDADSFELKTVILETPTCQPGTAFSTDAMEEAERGTIPETVNSSYHVIEAASFPISGQAKDDSSYGGDSTSQETSTRCERDGSACLRSPAVQPESHASSKEVDQQPSPVSVLEAPFVEDVSSSSECFERVSADLQGLRMQLQLLRLESKSFSEDDGALQVSSDDAREDSPLGFNLPKQFLVDFEECWETSYLGDVLETSMCFDDETTPESFMATWYSPDCPIGSMVFDRLEKAYVHEMYCSRQDRRLLFDRINTGILALSRKLMDPHPWVKSGVCRVVRRRWRKHELEAALWKVLESQEEEGTGGDGMALDETDWVDLPKHIDGIGRDIEKMILEELTHEVFDNIGIFVCM